jgi:hypothetical protein
MERQNIDDRTAEEKSQEMCSEGLSVGVYVRRRIFELPDIRKCYSVRIS